MKPELKEQTTETFLPGVSTFLYEGLINFCHVRIPLFMEWIMPGFPSTGYTNLGPEKFRHEDFSIMFLSDEELARLNSFKALKKQTEWMCGRFAAKTLAIKNMPDSFTPLPDIRVLNTTKGVPYMPDLPGYAVSISHSHEHAMAALVIRPEYRIGIDIEKISQINSSGFMNLAFSEREIRHIGKSDSMTITSSWSMKEAILKLIGKGFHHPLKHAEIIDNSVFIDGVRNDSIIHRSMSLDKEFVLSIAYQQLFNHRVEA